LSAQKVHQHKLDSMLNIPVVSFYYNFRLFVRKIRRLRVLKIGRFRLPHCQLTPPWITWEPWRISA